MTTFWNESTLGALLNQGALHYNKRKLIENLYKMILLFKVKLTLTIFSYISRAVSEVLVPDDRRWANFHFWGPRLFFFLQYLFFKLSMPTTRQ